MLIWSGHGILIPVFAVIGSILGGVIVSAICSALGVQNDASPGIIASTWSAALGVFFYAKTIGKTKADVYLDPKTHREVTIAKRHSFFFIPAVAWMYLSGLFAAFMTVTMMFGGDPDASKPKALSEAESAIISDRKGVSHGNTPQALKLAADFGSGLKSIREATITQGKKSSFSLTGGEFLTHCQMSDHGIAFLVHVPSLRKFTQEAKDVIAMGAEALAVSLAKKTTPAPARVAIGIRGSISYDRVIVVDLNATEPLPDVTPDSSSDEEAKLLPFYQDSPLTAAPVEAGKTLASPIEAVDKAEAPEPTLPAKANTTDAPSAPAAVPPPAPMPSAVPATVPASEPIQSKASLPAEEKDWASSDGRTLRATLLRFLPGEPLTGEFKRQDGSVFSIAVDRFAPETQQQLRELAAKMPR